MRRAVDRGEIDRAASCEDCGAAVKLHAHHDDYSQPLIVRWLCPACHKLDHRAGASAARGTLGAMFEIGGR